MMKTLKIILAAVLLYLIFMVVLFPARFATATLAQLNAIPPAVKLGNVSGSIWDGKLASVSYQGVVLDSINWQLSPLSILTGTALIDFKAGQRRSDIRAHGQIAFNSQGVSADDLSVKAPLSVVLQHYPLPYGLTSTGNIDLSIAHFQQDKPWCESLDGKFNANELIIKSAFGQLAVDKVSAKLSCPNGVLTAALQPSTNSLGINGTAQLTKTRQYMLDAKVKPPVNAPQDYINVLKFSGSPNSQGQYVFKYNGKL